MKEIDTNIIAFDFFDTIVHRNCHPEEILYKWAKKCSRFFKFKIKAVDIYTIRKRIETAEKNNNVEEMSYNELILKIYRKLIDLQNILDVSENDFLNFSLDTEIELETNAIFVDMDVLSIIMNMYKEGKKILLVSDFYIGLLFFESILRKLEIREFFSEIFVSSELGKRKSTGNLYKAIFKKLQCRPEDITMYGNNYNSDYKIPKALGMKAIHREYKIKEKVISEYDLKKIYKKFTHRNQEKAPLNGYIAEILYFIGQLYEYTISQEVDTILFCSREGQLLKLLFDKYQEILWEDVVIQSKYFYVSRKSVLVPSLGEIEEENFELIFRQYKELSVYDFMKTIGFEETFILEMCKKIKINCYEMLSAKSDNLILLQLRQNYEFKKEYDKIRNLQKKYFLEYLNECSNVFKTKKIVLVDVGWKGTIQDCIRKILPGDIEVQGYYMGLRTREYGCQNPDSKRGILFFDYPQYSPNYMIFEHGYLFYEYIFTADHGPVVGYEINQAGQVVPKIQKKPKEMDLYNYIRPYQNVLVDTFEKLIHYYKQTYFLPNDLYAFMIKNALYRTCVDFPQIWKIRENIQGLVVENFGDFGHQKKKRLWELVLKQFCENPFFTVDIIVNITGKLHLFFLLPLVKIYCKCVYWIKAQNIEQKKG